jgi:hypothetical protein
MNPFYAEYIATAKRLAAERGLNWDLVYDGQGRVSKETRWNLTELVGMLPPPTLWLGQIGVDPVAFLKLNEIRQRMNQEPLLPSPMARHWRDLYQAVLLHQLLVRKTKPLSATQVAQGVRRLAPAAEDTPPWAVKPEQIQQAYNSVLHSAASGKLALDFATMVIRGSLIEITCLSMALWTDLTLIPIKAAASAGVYSWCNGFIIVLLAENIYLDKMKCNPCPHTGTVRLRRHLKARRPVPVHGHYRFRLMTQQEKE